MTSEFVSAAFRALPEYLVPAAQLLFAVYSYDILVSLAGFLPLPPPPRGVSPVPHRFAVIVCAHDEATVIQGVVRSLLATEYPADARRIFVVADNCSDDTAAVARSAGAEVLVRHDLARRTKGYALQWGMDQVAELGQFDALCVVDADNLVSADLFSVLSNYLTAGHEAIQVYLDTKNPNDTWVTRSIALAYHITNRFWLRSRERLGLPTTLGGTGFCLTWKLVQDYRWDPGSLADDLELSMRLLVTGKRVCYCPHTRIFDEKPRTVLLSMRQRMRWMQGHNDVALRWIGPTLRYAVRHRSWGALDAALYLVQPVRLLCACLIGVLLIVLELTAPETPGLSRAFLFSVPALVLLGLVFVVYPLIVAAAEGAFWFAVRNMLPFMLFAFTWVPATLVGLVRMRNRQWLHTSHAHAATEPARLRNAPD